MLESLNYSFRNPKNIIWIIYRIKQLRNYKKKKTMGSSEDPSWVNNVDELGLVYWGLSEALRLVSPLRLHQRRRALYVLGYGHVQTFASGMQISSDVTAIYHFLSLAANGKPATVGEGTGKECRHGGDRARYPRCRGSVIGTAGTPKLRLNYGRQRCWWRFEPFGMLCLDDR